MLSGWIVQPSASAARTASSIARWLPTGRAPGKPRQTGHTFWFGREPTSTEHPQNSFVLVSSWAWTSSPITGSYRVTSGSERQHRSVVRLLARDTGVRRIAGFVARVRALLRAVPPAELQQQILLEDELLPRIVRCGVQAGVHADRVHGTSLDAEAAEHAAQLVDHELRRVTLVAAPRIT